MEIELKVEILKKLDTKELIEKLHKYEDKLEEAMRDNASFKDLNHGYLASSDRDCAEVKRIIAELSAKIPEADQGKKMTIADKEAWLLRQRTENAELAGAIARQKSTSFLIENNEIGIEIAKKRLEGLRAVLGLKTAQLNFLAS